MPSYTTVSLVKGLQRWVGKKWLIENDCTRPSDFPKPAIKYLHVYGNSLLSPGLKYLALHTYIIPTIFLVDAIRLQNELSRSFLCVFTSIILDFQFYTFDVLKNDCTIHHFPSLSAKNYDKKQQKLAKKWLSKLSEMILFMQNGRVSWYRM